MHKEKTVIATFAALGAQIIFGFSFMFTKIALEFASPMTVIAGRYMVAFICLTIVMLAGRIKISIGKNIWKLILMSLFQPLLYFVFESYGIMYTTSSFSAIMISMIPVVAMLVGIFALNEVPSSIQYMFAVLSVIGVVVVSLVGKSDGTVTFTGIVLLLGAVFSSVAYNVSSRKISSEFTVFERTYAMTVIGTISFLLLALIDNEYKIGNLIEPFKFTDYSFAVVYLGVFSSVVAFLLLNFANTYLPVVKTTVFSNITTVVSVIAGMIFLDEKISPSTIAAVLMILIGVIGVQISGMKTDSDMRK